MWKDLKQTQTQGQSGGSLAAVLVVLAALAASILALVLMKAGEPPTLENDTAFLEAYIAEGAASPLSEAQKRLIHESAAITASSAECEGVTVTLRAACGNWYRGYYVLEVTLPEDLAKAYEGLSFGEAWMGLDGQEQGRLGGRTILTEPLEDDNPADNRFSLLVDIRHDPYQIAQYDPNDGIAHTLWLEGLRLTGKDGAETRLEGAWTFGVRFRDRGEALELLREPVTVRGIDYLHGTTYEPGIYYYEAEVSSLILTEFTISYRYEVTPASTGGARSLRPVVILRDGKTVQVGSGGGGNDVFHRNLAVPVALSEVAFVKLTDEVVLPVNPLR